MTNDQFPTETSGNYSMDSKTGQFAPGPGNAGVTPTNPNQLTNTVQALMKGYLRKQPEPGSYIPLSSAAPSSMSSAFNTLDRYRSFGVPYTGIQYGQGGQGSSGQGDQYSAMFSSPSGY